MYLRNSLLVPALGILILGFYVGYLAHKRHSSPPADADVQGKDPDPVYKGDPIHLARIDNTINLLRKESLELSMSRLAEDELYLYPDFHSFSNVEQVNLHTILANRRVVKVLQQSRSLDRKTRADICCKLLDHTLRRHKNLIDIVISFYMKTGSPENKDSITSSQLALGAALLIVADASPLPQVIGAVSKIEDVTRSVRQRLSQSPAVPPAVNNFLLFFAQPDDALIVSAIGHCVAKHYTADNSLSQAFSQSVVGVPTASIPVVGWDARLTGFDFPHLNESMPIDESRGVEQITVYRVEEARPPVAASTVVSKMADALSKK